MRKSNKAMQSANHNLHEFFISGIAFWAQCWHHVDRYPHQEFTHSASDSAPMWSVIGSSPGQRLVAQCEHCRDETRAVGLNWLPLVFQLKSGSTALTSKCRFSHTPGIHHCLTKQSISLNIFRKLLVYISLRSRLVHDDLSVQYPFSPAQLTFLHPCLLVASLEGARTAPGKISQRFTAAVPMVKSDLL